MSKKLLFVLFCLSISLTLACAPAAEPNANSANSANVLTNVDPKNMPEGLSTTPVPPSSNSTPGIPAANAVNSVPKGATPTPGIPANPGKPLPKGATPTPGIPDPETLKKQMNQPANNFNGTNPIATDPAANVSTRPPTVRKP